MPGQSYDIIVIGAGFGGSSCAALLAQKGLTVLLLDKNARPGGKALTISKNGFTYTVWLVNSAPLQDNLLKKTLEELGVDDKVELVGTDNIITYFKNSQGVLTIGPDSSSSELDPNQIFDWLELSETERDEALRFFGDITLMPPETIETLNDISFGEWMSRYNITQNLKSFMSFLTDGCFLVPVERQCCAETIRTMQAIFLRGGNHFCKGGWGKAAEAFADAVEANNGSVMMKTRVDKIIVKDGSVTGVNAGGNIYNAPIVISNIGIQPTILKLIDNQYVEDSYLDDVKQLKPSWGFMGTRYFLNKRITDKSFGILFSPETAWTDEKFNKARAGEMPEDVPLWYEVPTNYDPNSSPEGKMIIMTGFISPSDPEMTQEEIDRWLAKGEEMILQIFPDLPKYIENREHYTPHDVSALTRDHVLAGQGGECIGLAQCIGQAGSSKPSFQSPIQGLFYVGCDAGGTGIGIHQAVDSGINVANAVYKQIRG